LIDNNYHHHRFPQHHSRQRLVPLYIYNGSALTRARESVADKSGPAGAHKASVRVGTDRVFITAAVVSFTFVHVSTPKRQ